MRYKTITKLSGSGWAVVMYWSDDAGSSRTGQTIFEVASDSAGVAGLEADMLALAAAANASECSYILDHAVEFEDVSASDVRDFTAIIRTGHTPFQLPVEFTESALDEVVRTVFDGQPSDLAEYAVKAAIDELLPNWKAALSEGSPIASLVSDVDEVIAKLQHFKALCAVKGSAAAQAITPTEQH